MSTTLEHILKRGRELAGQTNIPNAVVSEKASSVISETLSKSVSVREIPSSGITSFLSKYRFIIIVLICILVALLIATFLFYFIRKQQRPIPQKKSFVQGQPAQPNGAPLRSQPQIPKRQVENNFDAENSNSIKAETKTNEDQRRKLKSSGSSSTRRRVAALLASDPKPRVAQTENTKDIKAEEMKVSLPITRRQRELLAAMQQKREQESSTTTESSTENKDLKDPKSHDDAVVDDDETENLEADQPSDEKTTEKVEESSVIELGPVGNGDNPMPAPAVKVVHDSNVVAKEENLPQTTTTLEQTNS